MSGTALENTDSLHRYLQDIQQFSLLDPQQEQQLAIGCARGDQDAIRQMVNANLRLVVSIAMKYKDRDVPLLDLIQEGSIGLLEAAKGYDHARGNRFSTYATKSISGKIKRYLLEQEGGLIHLPEDKAKQLGKLRASRTALMAQLEREPTEEELAKHSGVALERVQLLGSILPQICSLDAPVSEDNGYLQQLLEDVQAPQPQETLVRRELRHTLDGLLALLTERQRQVLTMRFGMESGADMSLGSISERLGISKERARQIEREALDKLKKLGADLGLEDFLE